MNQVMIDIWPYLITALLAVIGWLFRQLLSLKEQIKTLEKTVEGVQTQVNKTIESIVKTIENIQKRQDSHSKKQDEIVNLITELKVEVVRQIGNMTTELGVLSADVKNINRVLSVNDDGIKFKTKNNR